MRGTVTKVEWTNPHARVYIDVRDDKGQTANWNFEMASPNILVRNGWKQNTVKIGDQITVSGYLAQGYQVIQSEIGNPFLQFILKKDNQLVWCSVELRSGETQSCRAIK